MSNEQEGGTAFPVVRPDGMGVQYYGMSLRDYFSAHITIDHDEVGVRYAVAIVGRDIPDFAADPLGNASFWAEYRASMRYIEADAMLAERAK